MKKKKNNKKNINKQVLNIIKIVKKYYLKYSYILYIIIPLIAMDIITRIFGRNISFFKLYSFTPNAFTITWIILFVGLTICFKKRIGKIIYLFTNILFLAFFLTNNVYYSLTKTFFDFHLMESASEGSPYILDTLKSSNIWVYISSLFIIYLIYLGYKKIPYKTKNNKKGILFTIIIFTIFHFLTPLTLGKANTELTWSSWRNPRNVYMSFNDNNKSMKVSGLYEYTIRNFYVTFLKERNSEDTEDIEFLNTSFTNKQKEDNNYTGIFKGKNLIFLQLEGIDNWLLTKEDTPTLYSMLNNSINFNNHYSYYNGGGSTFNSEFAVNTGFITPLSYTQNAYTFNKNKFPYSMAKLFKKENYSVNAFHMNTGEYYSRTTNYQNWGYDNYYGLIDIQEYKDDSYKLDRELILNEQFNELLYNTEKPFVDYIITFTAHMPFSTTKGVCKQLIELDNAKELDKQENAVESNNEEKETIEMTEEECARRQAKETDYMVELLLQKLTEKEIIDNTVIVAFSDHYLYTIEDKTILDKYKNTSNNLINKTPFFIWSKNLKNTTINKATSQLNILPTTLNLFGIDYNPNNYIGVDALSKDYSGIVFFSDYSWYDGNVYVENAEVTNNKNISYENLEDKNYYINYITKKNDLALKYNYFNKKEITK